MADMMELLELRQGDKSNEQFANEMGLRGSTLWRYYKGDSDINTVARQKMIEYFSDLGDEEMVGALLAYKTGPRLDPDELVLLGRCFLGFVKKTSPAVLTPSV